MQYLIKSYSAYDPKVLGTPWGAPSDSTGKPYFKEKIAHYTGSRGSAGDLFVEDPSEGSVWIYGQKNYSTYQSNKSYLQFQSGKFHALTEDELLPALKSASQIPSDDLKRDKLIKILLNEICSGEQNRALLHLSDILKKHGISPDELAMYGINPPLDCGGTIT